jgi:hypothetical protein
MDPEPKQNSPPMKPERNPGERPILALSIKNISLALVLLLFLSSLLYLVFCMSREKQTFIALYNPDQLFEEGSEEADSLKERKSEIFKSLNEDINQEDSDKSQEANRLLASLDRLWRSLKRYVSPSKPEMPPPPSTPMQAADRRTYGRLEGGTGLVVQEEQAEEADVQDEVLYNILALSRDPEVIREASGKRGGDGEARREPPSPEIDKALQSPLASENSGTRSLEEFLYNLEPRDGVRTRGVAWKLHRNVTLEGTVDTTHLGQVDDDLSDFGFRSVHALTFLRNQTRPVMMMGFDNIESGYPRSYGIGLNFRLSSSMQMLFDYSHEYPTDHIIEYRGNWESSLLTDYAKKRPDNSDGDVSIHNFFFGLRYLHRMEKALIPVHTGFFYSTNMAEEPFPSDVSMGFSVGGGYQKNALQMGVSYRLRIWENPEDQLLMEMVEEDFDRRVSNQVLFFISF